MKGIEERERKTAAVRIDRSIVSVSTLQELESSLTHGPFSLGLHTIVAGEPAVDAVISPVLPNSCGIKLDGSSYSS